MNCKKCGKPVNSKNTSKDYGVCMECNPRVIEDSSDNTETK